MQTLGGPYERPRAGPSPARPDGGQHQLSHPCVVSKGAADLARATQNQGEPLDCFAFLPHSLGKSSAAPDPETSRRLPSTRPRPGRLPHHFSVWRRGLAAGQPHLAGQPDSPAGAAGTQRAPGPHLGLPARQRGMAAHRTLGPTRRLPAHAVWSAPLRRSFAAHLCIQRPPLGPPHRRRRLARLRGAAAGADSCRAGPSTR